MERSVARLHRVSSPKGITAAEVEGLSCFGRACDAVGYFDKGATVTGYVLTITGGTPGRLQTVPGDSLYGVSCVSASRCYGAGFTRSGGLVVTLNDGKASLAQHVTPDLMSIACAGSSCTAAGEQLPPVPSSDAFWGDLVDVSAGKVTATLLVSPSGGFSGVARSGAFFAAVGSVPESAVRGHDGLTSRLSLTPRSSAARQLEQRPTKSNRCSLISTSCSSEATRAASASACSSRTDGARSSTLPQTEQAKW